MPESRITKIRRNIDRDCRVTHARVVLFRRAGETGAMKPTIRDIAAALLSLQGLRASGNELQVLDRVLTEEQMLDFVHDMALEAMEQGW